MPSLTLKCDDCNGLIIPILIVHPDPSLAQHQHQILNAVIDTGARTTTVEDDIAVRLGLPITDYVPLNAVNSTATCPVYLARIQIQFQGTTKILDLKAIPVIGVQLPDYADCLIGRDILKQGSLIYEGKKGLFRLEF